MIYYNHVTVLTIIKDCQHCIYKTRFLATTGLLVMVHQSEQIHNSYCCYVRPLVLQNVLIVAPKVTALTYIKLHRLREITGK